MTNITIEISGDKEVMARLHKAQTSVSGLRPAMSKIGTYLTGFFSGEVFASRGRVIGESWMPLKASTARSKARNYPGRPPLIRTGLMQRSFKDNVGSMSVRIYNSAKHFPYQQAGTRSIPARVMMKVDQARQREIVNIVRADIERSLR